MMPRMMSLAVTPRGSSPSTRTSIVFGLRCGSVWVARHVLDLAGADAKGERAEGAMRAGVAVAADDGHARLGQAELGADDVHDALQRAEAILEADAKFLAVALERVEHAPWRSDR